MGPLVFLGVLLLLVLLYGVVGALIFIALEADNEISRQVDLLDRLLVFVDKHRCLDRAKMMSLMDYIDRDMDTARYVLHHNVTYNVMWDWTGAASFVVSVITTIGYGHITPRTPQGKIACMVYAMIGIPLLLVFLKGAGELLFKVCGRCMHLFGRCAADSKGLQRLNAILQSILGLTIMFILPVVVNIYQEGWSPLDSIYSCFVTLTTIGFGDFVAGNPADRESFQQSTGMLVYRLVSLLWTLVGLAYISMIITAISNYYVQKTQGVKMQAERGVQKLRKRVGQKLSMECSMSNCSISTQTDSPSSPSTPTLPHPHPHCSNNVAADMQVRLLAFSRVPDGKSVPDRSVPDRSVPDRSVPDDKPPSAGGPTKATFRAESGAAVVESAATEDDLLSSGVKGASIGTAECLHSNGTAKSINSGGDSPEIVNLSTITQANGVSPTSHDVGKGLV
ncbi:hypothetical protein ACOMHN_015253 [Nucella lapillus]